MDELVATLRRQCAEMDCGNCNTCVKRQATEVIEELPAFREQITDGHFYCMKDGVLYAAKVERPKGKSIQLPPIEFAEPPEEERA